MAVTTLLLMLAALCQLLLVFICVWGFLELVYLQTAAGDDRVAQPRTALGPPGTIAVVFSAMFLSASLLLLSFPSFVVGELPNGLFLLSSIGFGGFAMAAVVAMSVTRSTSKLVVGQLVASVVGLICMFAVHYLAAEA